MFWIGLIVGILLCVLAYACVYWYGTHYIWSSPEEFRDCVGAVYGATQNRESTLIVEHNGEVIYDVELLER